MPSLRTTCEALLTDKGMVTGENPALQHQHLNERLENNSTLHFIPSFMQSE